MRATWVRAFLGSLGDNLGLVAAAVLGFGFTALCLHLAGLPGSLVPVLGYGLAVAALGLVLALAAGARKRSRYLRTLEEFRDAGEADGLPVFGAPGPDATARAWEETARDLRRRFLTLLEAERDLRREQGDFFTQWVHQVKTPLSVLGLLAEARNWPEVAAEAARIDEALRKALGFSRLHDLAADFLVRDVDLLDLCRRSLEPYRPLVQAKGLAVETSGDWSPAAADPKWLLFLLDQLVSNAVKYTPPGGTLRFASADARFWTGPLPPGLGPRGRLLTLSNTGPAIPAEDLDRVWNRSFTGARGRQDLSATGMGLWLARRMGEAMEIRMGILSSPEEGTTVFLGFGS